MDNFGREEKFYTIYAFVPDWINMDIVLVFPDCCGATIVACAPNVYIY